MTRITIWGLIATLLYVTFIATYVFYSLPKFQSLAPNEWGDFMAGVFGPLGFFWLICGYFQQGVELQQNTKALELQALELKNSVDQQRELVAVTREQLQIEFEEVRRQRDVLHRAALPVITAKSGGAFSGGNASMTLYFTNVGAEVRDVIFDPSGPYELKVPSIDLWLRGATHDVKFFVGRHMALEDFNLCISYLDMQGNQGAAMISVKLQEEDGGPLRFKTVVEVHNPR